MGASRSLLQKEIGGNRVLGNCKKSPNDPRCVASSVFVSRDHERPWRQSRHAAHQISPYSLLWLHPPDSRGFEPQPQGRTEPVGAGTGCGGGWLDLEGALRMRVEGEGRGLRFRGRLCQEACDADLPGTG